MDVPKLNSRRSQEDIVSSILHNLSEYGPQKKTWIMYSSMLSWYQLLQYMKYCIDHDMIKSFKDDMYSITKNGEEYLNKYDQLKEFVTKKKEVE